jgi:hypothetical protein
MAYRIVYQGQRPATPPSQRTSNIIPGLGRGRIVQPANIVDPLPLCLGFPRRAARRTV